MGELGMVGIPAAIANAVFHATGKRIRDLPITPDKTAVRGTAFLRLKCRIVEYAVWHSRYGSKITLPE